jgi:hypothetical protein
MSVSRPPVVEVGAQVRYAGSTYTVIGLVDGQVHLADVVGVVSQVPVGRLLAEAGFGLVTATPTRAALTSAALLDGVPAEAARQALWWERHLVEVLTGLPPEQERGTRAKPQYDPAVRSLRQREIAKVTELAGAGRPVALRTLQRARQRYEAKGLWGLVDARLSRPSAPLGRADARVVDAIRQAVAEQSDISTGTVGRLRRRVAQILTEVHGADAPTLPPKTTFYRLVERVAAGKHTFGSARTRQSLAKRPDGPFGTLTAARPGEWMQIDSTPLDVRVVLDNGLVDRVELTWMVDLATKTLSAAVLRPTTKAVDAALLLARTLTPEPMRPGWTDALRMARSVLPHRRLLDVDQRLEHAAARPVIVPETIVCDHGKVYLSQTFRNACRAMGINLQPTHKGSPWEKGTVERSFASVGSLFAQYVAGYVGPSVERRGRNAEQTAVWSAVDLQAQLDEWIVAVWQNRPNDGLRHPLVPGKALTPNEQYAALIETAGYVPVPLSAEDYIELLPATWRVINAYGIKINNRVYDGQALNPYRRQHSGVTARRGLWEVHHDPYDVSQVWVRNHHDGGWLTAVWTHLRSAPAPFGELAWDHSRRMLAARGGDPATEAEIAQAAAALLDRAEQGPTDTHLSTKDRRVAGRTRATTKPTTIPAWRQPHPAAASPPGPHDEPDEDGGDGEELAEVIPLEVFDARKEAQRWW